MCQIVEATVNSNTLNKAKCKVQDGQQKNRLQKIFPLGVNQMSTYFQSEFKHV